VRALGHRLSGHCFVVTALVVACSVFPDEALLPTQGAAGSGTEGGAPSEAGSSGMGAAARAGESSVVPLGGTASAGGSAGSSAGGSAGSSPHVEGGETGQAGAGAAPAEVCAAPQELTERTNLDLWIGASEPTTNHGGEHLLQVSGGADERRALFALTVPAAAPGQRLLRAEILLELESNADATLAPRQLGLHLQTPLRAVSEGKATWVQWGTNKNKDVWDTAGGDLSELVTSTDIPAGTSRGVVRFDVTAAVASVLGPQPSLYGLVVLELGAAPPAPAALAFTSREGNDSVSAALRLRYCQP
jgi:hypothetical protein